MAEHGSSTTTIFFALGANAVIAVAKTVAAFITGSGSIAAEAVHSLADCGNQGLLLLGSRARRGRPIPSILWAMGARFTSGHSSPP